MKAIYFIFLFTTSLFAQDLEYLKSRDTLYLIMPKEGKVQFSKFTYWSDSNNSQNNYEFKQPDGKYIFILTVTDKEAANVKKNIIVKRRHFFKRERRSIIDVDFLDRVGLFTFFMEVVRGNGKKKVVYIINGNELSNRRLILKEGVILDLSFISI